MITWANNTVIYFLSLSPFLFLSLFTSLFPFLSLSPLLSSSHLSFPLLSLSYHVEQSRMIKRHQPFTSQEKAITSLQHYWHFLLLLFSLGATPGSTKGLLTVLHSEITPGGYKGPPVMPRIDLGPVVCNQQPYLLCYCSGSHWWHFDLGLPTLQNCEMINICFWSHLTVAFWHGNISWNCLVVK